MKKLALLALLSFSSASKSATVYTYIDDVVDAGLWYTFKIYSEWDTSNTANTACYIPSRAVERCEIGADIVFLDTQVTAQQIIPMAYSDCTLNAKTYGELTQCLSALSYSSHQLGNPSAFNYQLSKTGDDIGNICLRWRIRATITGSGSMPWENIPDQVCGLAPPPIGTCSTPSSIEFDHGVVNTNFSNNKLIKTFNVECNMDTSASISFVMLDSNGNLKLGDNIYSTLKVNDKYADLLTTYNLKTGGNAFTISSELNRTGVVKAGDYSGQTIMTLAVD